MEETERNLVKEIKRIDFRARAYKLSDDGASDQARKRRFAKDAKSNGRDPSSIEYHKKAIAALRKVQDKPETVERFREVSEVWIARHEQEIRQLESLDSPELIVKPTVRVVAPIARRVRREDRRRTKLEKRLKKD
jgi:hypothetical protein